MIHRGHHCRLSGGPSGQNAWVTFGEYGRIILGERRRTLEKENPNCTLIATMTEMEKSHRSWHGETGLIDKEMLARYLKDAMSPVYYIAGPPGMVKGLHMMINESGVDERDIRTEEFSGY